MCRKYSCIYRKILHGVKEETTEYTATFKKKTFLVYYYNMIVLVVILQVIIYCNPDGLVNEHKVTFDFSCTSCPTAETPFFFRVELETLGRLTLRIHIIELTNYCTYMTLYMYMYMYAWKLIVIPL